MSMTTSVIPETFPRHFQVIDEMTDNFVFKPKWRSNILSEIRGRWLHTVLRIPGATVINPNFELTPNTNRQPSPDLQIFNNKTHSMFESREHILKSLVCVILTRDAKYLSQNIYVHISSTVSNILVGRWLSDNLNLVANGWVAVTLVSILLYTSIEVFLLNWGGIWPLLYLRKYSKMRVFYL